jgi:hypothetical protein
LETVLLEGGWGVIRAWRKRWSPISGCHQARRYSSNVDMLGWPMIWYD